MTTAITFYIFLIIISWIAATSICVSIGKRKGAVELGWVAGVLLGWLGVVIMFCIDKTHEQEVRDAAHRMEIEQEAARWASHQARQIQQSSRMRSESAGDGQPHPHISWLEKSGN